MSVPGELDRGGRPPGVRPPRVRSPLQMEIPPSEATLCPLEADPPSEQND